MEIREPRFQKGQKVMYEGNLYIVLQISSYSFSYNEYLYRIEDDVKQCVKSEEELEPYIEKPKSVWNLKEGDTYYLISSDGEVIETTWGYCPHDKKFREIGNAFLTKAEAEFEVERRKIETEMLRLGGRRKFKFNGNNFSIYYSDGLNVKGINVEFYHSTMHQGSIYFDSKEQLNEVVKTISLEKIKKYIFGVES